jgi:hypothetical protein
VSESTTFRELGVIESLALAEAQSSKLKQHQPSPSQNNSSQITFFQFAISNGWGFLYSKTTSFWGYVGDPAFLKAT